MIVDRQYEELQVEVILFENEDVVCASPNDTPIEGNI